MPRNRGTTRVSRRHCSSGRGEGAAGTSVAAVRRTDADRREAGTRTRRPAGRIDLEIAMDASPWDVTWLGARRDSHPGGRRLDHWNIDISVLDTSDGRLAAARIKFPEDGWGNGNRVVRPLLISRVLSYDV